MTKHTLLILLVILASCTKDKASIKEHYQLLGSKVIDDKMYYFIIDENNDTVKKFKNRYFHIWADTIKDVLITAPREKSGWWAIDKNENLLFEVYNTEYGFPSPDEFINGKIRIVGKDRKIGYANEKGEIVIQPQFEEASEFRNNYAIVGKNCKLITPKGHENEKGGCVHLRVECQENGYINEKGEIIEMEKVKFEDIAKKLKWPNY